jgi:GH24 family phage-related lysozyme (muramidase)
MIHSPACTALVMRSEGCRLTAYRDPVGIWTCGWGSTGSDVRAGTRWTQAQADKRLEADLTRADASVNALVDGVPTTQGQHDALVDFVYNLGSANLASSTLLRRHRARDYAAAAAQFGQWIYAGNPKVVLAGLVKRRAAEAALYRGAGA